MTMAANNKRALQGFRLMSEFLERHAVTSSVSDLKVSRESLAEVVDRMAKLAEQRERAASDSRIETQQLNELRRTVETKFLAPLRALSRADRALAPGLVEVVRVPVVRSVVSQVAVTRGVVDAARQHAAAFARAGLAADYAEQLNTLVEEIERALTRRGQRQAEVAGAVSGLKAEGKRGRAVVALLETLVRPALAHHPALLREWQSVRRRAVWLNPAQQEAELTREAPGGEPHARAA